MEVWLPRTKKKGGPQNAWHAARFSALHPGKATNKQADKVRVILECARGQESIVAAQFCRLPAPEWGYPLIGEDGFYVAHTAAWTSPNRT